MHRLVSRGAFTRVNRKMVVRALALVALGFIGMVAAYLALLCHPGFFFSHEFSRGGITLYSDEPIPAGPAGQILMDLESRLVRSPLAARPLIKAVRVYICNRSRKFVLFANTRYSAGGIAYSLFSDNIFLRAAHFDANRLVGPSGNEAPGARTLSYFIAHS
jgi:hypothetical protein